MKIKLQEQSLAFSKDKREYVRVMAGRKVKVFTDNSALGEYFIRDLSVTSLFIEGGFSLAVGTACRLVVDGDGFGHSPWLNIFARVTRVERQGVVVSFTSMHDEDYMLLQTMLLYSSNEPMIVAEDFQDTFDYS